ncbi:hypothetical protein Ddye_000554, partial [Dipteronia dyeriana]
QAARALPFKQEVIPGAPPSALESKPEVPGDLLKGKPKLDTNLIAGVPPAEILARSEFLEPFADATLADYEWLIASMQKPDWFHQQNTAFHLIIFNSTQRLAFLGQLIFLKNLKTAHNIMNISTSTCNFQSGGNMPQFQPGCQIENREHETFSHYEYPSFKKQSVCGAFVVNPTRHVTSNNAMSVKQDFGRFEDIWAKRSRTCGFGQFANASKEFGDVINPNPRLGMLKTKLCNNWEMTGGCLYGKT